MTNSIAERAVRRVKEGTSAVLLQSGLGEQWAGSMECHCYLRNVQDLLADRKRFGQLFKGPIISLGAMVEYYPTSARDQARLHQFGKKVLPSIFLGYALIAGGIWEGNILIADIEDLEIVDASEIIECKRSLDNSEKRRICTSCGKLSVRDYEFQEPTSRREQTVKRERESRWRFSRRRGRISTDRIER